MKLAEALILRSELKKEAEDLFVRVEENTFYDDDQVPMEDSKELFARMKELLFKFEKP